MKEYQSSHISRLQRETSETNGLATPKPNDLKRSLNQGMSPETTSARWFELTYINLHNLTQISHHMTPAIIERARAVKKKKNNDPTRIRIWSCENCIFVSTVLRGWCFLIHSCLVSTGNLVNAEFRFERPEIYLVLVIQRTRRSNGCLCYVCVFACISGAVRCCTFPSPL